MPFARPSPRASPSNSLPSSVNSSSPASSYSVIPSSLPSSLATPWSSQAAETQLRAMTEEASLGIAASPGGSSSPEKTSQALPQAFPTPTKFSSMSNGTPTSSPALAKSKMSMKQRLFQISDDEADVTIVESDASTRREEGTASSEKRQESETTDDEEDPDVQIRKQREAIARMRAARNEPMRRSISALSGVTVIGKGHARDREGSTSTISSLQSRRSNGSIDAGTNLSPSLEQDEDEDQQIRSFPVPHASSDHKDRAAMDFKAALDLLHTYPGSAAGPSNRESSSEPAADRSHTDVSGPSQHFAQQEASGLPQRSRSPSTISSHTSGLSRPRKHSRSSIGERDRLFGPLSPITPTENMAPATSPHSLHAEVETDIPAGNGSSTEPQGDSEIIRKSPRMRPPSFSSFSFHGSASHTGTHPYVEPSTRPPMTSRRSSKASELGLAGEGRPIMASRSASSADLAQIMRSFHARPRRSPSSRSGRQSEAHSPVLDATDALRRSTRSTGQSPDIKSLIQQKRRQASAPFKTLASSGTISSIASPAGSGPSSPILSVHGTQSPRSNTDESFPWHPSPPARRLRSRRNTAAMGSLASLSTSQIDPSDAFYQARLQALRGVGQVVMTPSVEEWRQLGLSEDLNDRGDSSSSSDSDSSDPSPPLDPEEGKFLSPAVDQTPRPRMGSIQAVNQFYGSLPPRDNGTWMNRSHTSPELSRSASIRKSPRHDDISDLSGEGDYSRDKDEDEPSYDAEAYFRRKSSNAIPTLSRGSLSAHTGSPFPGAAPPAPAEIKKALTAHIIQDSLDSTPVKSHDYTRTVSTTRDTSLAPSPNPQLPVLKSRSQSPIPLSTTGPMDPRQYSAVTGYRSIDTFAVVSEAGKGAYGLVRKVREIGQDGYPIGPDLMLKYIVKQRILADAYKRHKVLGVIPMEIHVLDHIRKAYRSPTKDPLKTFLRTPVETPKVAPTDPSPINVGHPNLCGMLDFFEDAENYYLVMACFGNGQDLFDYVDMAPTGLSVSEARSILGQITDAVAFLHAHGIVHRDIKDENIILDGQGGVQLIDFGSAAYIKEGKPYFDTFSGTLDFASPEVLRGERYGGKETDIWALGVLSYVILCGECPFWSSEESMAGLAVGSRAEEALRVRADEVEESLAADAQAAFAQEADAAIDFVHQCLQTHSKNRPNALQLKDHKFLNTQTGWSGFRGWEEAVEVSASDEESS